MSNTTQELDGYLDLFSGYGGFHKAVEEAGFSFKKTYFSEIDKHAIANYSYNYPNSQYAGPIQSISGTTCGKLNLITFGWPCQDNSIAGKRRGQSEGTRSGLLYEAIRIVNLYKTTNFIAENVKGLYSVNSGVDFRNAVEVLAYLNENLPQYDIEMQLCNTRWVLPQNRERLFFIGHLRGSGSHQVFPIGEGVGICNERGSEKSGQCASTLNANDKKSWVGNFVEISDPAQGELHGRAVMPAIPNGGHNSTNKKHSHSLVLVQNPTPLEITRIGNTNPCGHGMNGNIYDVTGISPTLSTNKGEGIKIVSKENYISWDTNNKNHDSHYARAYYTDGVVGSLNKSNEPKILVPSATKSGYEEAQEGDSINLSIPNSSTRRGRVGKGVAQTLDTSCNQGTIDRLYSMGESKPGRQCIGSSRIQECGNSKRSIRRLTPVECERLQGLPDDWTKYGNYTDGVKEISDSQRYRLCGNGVSVPIVKVIAKRLFDLNYSKL